MLSLPGHIGKIEEDIASLTERSEENTLAISGINSRLILLEAQFNAYIQFSDNAISNNREITITNNIIDSLNMEKIKCVSVNSPVYLSEGRWNDSDIIAINTNGTQYTVGEFRYQKILIPYKNGNQEIFFYGQYNENNHWEGNCIINAYENDKLLFITEAEYSDGNIINYKQVFSYINSSGKVWGISDRENKGEYNSGVTWNYFFENDYIKEFNFEDVVASDILSINDFKNNFDLSIESFYFGNTSNNHYNDETGNAYIVKYAKDGTVRTLYVGNFIDGAFNDHTGNACDITRYIELNTGYMYYRGNFEDNRVEDNNTGEFELNISLERIKEILNDAHLDLDLNWYITDPI